MKLIEKFKDLPDELIIIIINYTNVVVYRNGKYIDRLKKNYERDVLLKRIPRPIYIVDEHKALLRLMNYNLIGYFIKYDTRSNYNTVNIRLFYRENDGIDRYFDIKSNNTYLFDANNKWTKIR
jgi:hypothetical protein